MSGSPRRNQHGPSRDVNQGRSIYFRRGEEMVERGREILSYDEEPFDVTEGDIGDPFGITVSITSSDTRLFRDCDKKPMSERLGKTTEDGSETMSKIPHHSRGRKRSRDCDKKPMSERLGKKPEDGSETMSKIPHHSRGRKRSRDCDKKPMSERLGKKTEDGSETMSKIPHHSRGRKRSRDCDKKPMSERLGKKTGDDSETMSKRPHHSRSRKRSRSYENSDGGLKGKYGKRKRHESSKRRTGRDENKHHRHQADYIADLEPVTPDAEGQATFMFDQGASMDEINYRETESRNYCKREPHPKSPVYYENRDQHPSSTYAMKVNRMSRSPDTPAYMSDRNNYHPRHLRERPPLPEIHDYNWVNRDANPQRQHDNRSNFPGDLAVRETFRRGSNGYNMQEDILSDVSSERISDQRDCRMPNQRADRFTDRETGQQQAAFTVPSNDLSSSRRELDRENHHHSNDAHRDHRIGLEPLEINPHQSLEEQLERGEFEEDVVAKPPQSQHILEASSNARAMKILEEMKIVKEKIKKRKLIIKKKENRDIDSENSYASSQEQTSPSRPDTSLKLQMHDATDTLPCVDEGMSHYCSPASPNDTTKCQSSSPTSVSNANATLNYTLTSPSDISTPLNPDSTSTPYAALSSPTRCAETSLITFGDLTQNDAHPSDAIVQPRSPIETQSSKMITPNLPDRETANAKTGEQYHHDQSAEAENEDPNITTEPLIKVDMQTNKAHTADQGSLQALEVTRPIKLEVDTHDVEHPNIAPDHGCTADSSQYEQIPGIKLENDQELSYNPPRSLEVPDKHDRGTIVPDSVSMNVSDTPGIIDGSINIMKHATVDEQNTVDPADDPVVVSMTNIEIIESSSQSPVSETLANIEATNNENNVTQRDSQVKTEITDCEHSSLQIITEADRQSTTNDENVFENTKLEEKNVPLDAENIDDLKTSKEQGYTGGAMIAMSEETDQTPFSVSDLTTHGNEDSRDDPDDTSLVIDLKLRVNDVDSLHIRSHHSGRWDISSGHVSGSRLEWNAEACDVIKKACLRLVEASQCLRNTGAEHETDGGDKESSTTE